MVFGSSVGCDYYGMVWYGVVWYDMVWYGMVWYGMVLFQSNPKYFVPENVCAVRKIGHQSEQRCNYLSKLRYHLSKMHAICNARPKQQTFWKGGALFARPTHSNICLKSCPPSLALYAMTPESGRYRQGGRLRPGERNPLATTLHRLRVDKVVPCARGSDAINALQLAHRHVGVRVHHGGALCAGSAVPRHERG